METPFIFGKIATEKNFTDREEETARLVRQFSSLVNSVVISPRRWGKSSLVHRAAEAAMAQDNKLKVCIVDLFNVRDEEEFYTVLAQGILSGTSSKWEEAVENAKRFFSRLVPRITISADAASAVSFDFDWEELRRNPDEILDLAEKIAVEKGLKIVVCIDEFQNIAYFNEPEYFQKKLRSHWQLQQHVAYCIYGSKKDMMVELFNSASAPFYKFGDFIFLKKIGTEDFVEFFKSRFAETGRRITDGACRLIVSLVENHPYYAQQLAQAAWFRTQEECTEDIVRQAHASLVEQLSLLFVKMTETLTSQQLRYLKALLSGEKSFSSTEVLYRYRISSVTSANRSKAALLKNDILDDSQGKIEFQDPLYAYWLKHEYFRLTAR